MNCDRQNRIHVRGSNGRVEKIIFRCADMTSPHFAREVTIEQCEKCPRYQQMQQAVQAAHSEEPKTPSLLQKATKYTKAVTTWVAAGAPKRSDEEVERIFEICESCQGYNEKKQTCSYCGCRLRQGGSGFFNKIRMSTEHCPKQKW